MDNNEYPITSQIVPEGQARYGKVAINGVDQNFYYDEAGRMHIDIESAPELSAKAARSYGITTEVDTRAERLAMEIIDQLGAAAFTDAVPNTFEYHLAIQAITVALKAINAAMSDVRESWAEDSKNRIKEYRKRGR